MAFQSKSEQRAAAATNYKGAESTLTSHGYERKTMAKDDSGPLVGSLKGVSGDAGKRMYGSFISGKPSGIAGRMSGDGYPSGPKWKRAMEPGELKPGKASQAKNTIVMKPGQGDKSPVMKSTGTTPKALRGGRVR